MRIDYKVPTKPERRICLVVVDMQECFFEEEGSKEKHMEAIRNIREAMDSFYEHGRDVFVIRYMGDTHSEKEDKSIIGELGDISRFKIVEKYHMSAFQNTNLTDLMISRGYDSALICGAYADHCVMSTYWSAYEHDMSPFLLEGALIAYSDEKLSAALKICMTFTREEMEENLRTTVIEPGCNNTTNRMKRKYWYLK
ncbi:MAG: cysteine hydrolase [Candidatus Methanomethylophilaceae archaeon]|nr:cysteine hydrolase [Candidatus Methanomethylophilaceae archaeon]